MSRLYSAPYITRWAILLLNTVTCRSLLLHQEEKLSKQNHATPVKNESALDNLVRVMRFLGFPFPQASEFGDIDSALKTAISMWNRKKVVKTPEIIVPQHESTYYSQPL